jgi:hypothetical protein
MALSDAERMRLWRRRQPPIELQCARCGKVRQVLPVGYPYPSRYCQPCGAGLSIKRRRSFRPSVASADETIDDRLSALNRDKD